MNPFEHTDERSKYDLPFDQRIEFAGKRVRLVHGSPRKVNEYPLEDRAASTFERIAQLADCGILLFGHTHKPWVREYGGVVFVNCGSVGKPKDGDPRGSFAVLTESDGGVSVAIERVAYDAESVARENQNLGSSARTCGAIASSCIGTLGSHAPCAPLSGHAGLRDRHLASVCSASSTGDAGYARDRSHRGLPGRHKSLQARPSESSSK